MRTQPLVQWRGQVWLSPGLGVFAGTSGSNDGHAHHAHQMTVARNGLVSVDCDKGHVEGRGIWIPAGHQHQLRATGDVVSIYVDPLFQSRPARMAFPEECEAMNSVDCKRLLEASAQMPNPQPLIEMLPHRAGVTALPSNDGRWPRILQALLESPTRGDLPDRDALASLACLSPSRFSHWFVEQAGLPLRAYRKWLRLQAALSAVATGRDLTTAAHASGFADASHLSRTFRTMFGIDPSTALARLEWQEVPELMSRPRTGSALSF